MRSSLFNEQSKPFHQSQVPSCRGRSIDSHLAHKRIEKDFLRENVKRLREIQAKCRGLDLRPSSRNVPLKALRKEVVPCISINCNKNERIGSGHSDYFSLSDGLPTTAHSVKLYDPNLYKRDVIADSNSHLNQKQRNLPHDNHFKAQYPSSNLTRIHSRSLSSLSSASSATVPDAAFPLKRPLLTSPLSMLQPSLLRKGKVGSVLEKVKSRKPSCETNTGNVWHDIESDHRALFGRKNILIPHYASNISCGRSDIGTNAHRPCVASNLRKSPSLNEVSSFRKGPIKPLTKSPETIKKHSIITADKSNASPDHAHVADDVSECSASSKASTELEWDDCASSFRRTSSLPRLCSSDDHEARESGQDVRPPCQTEIRPDIENPDKLDECRDNSNELNNFISVTSPPKTFSDISIQTNSNQEKGFKPVKLEISKAQMRSQLIRRSKSSNNLKCNPPPSYKRGEVPKYLLVRKEEDRRKREAAITDPACPPGHTLLPDEERKNTLELLKKGHSDVLSQMSRLPIAQDTLRVRRYREELEAKLTRIEEGIEIFSQPKVYVVDDE